MVGSSHPDPLYSGAKAATIARVPNYYLTSTWSHRRPNCYARRPTRGTACPALRCCVRETKAHMVGYLHAKSTASTDTGPIPHSRATEWVRWSERNHVLERVNCSPGAREIDDMRGPTASSSAQSALRGPRRTAHGSVSAGRSGGVYSVWFCTKCVSVPGVQRR